MDLLTLLFKLLLKFVPFEQGEYAKLHDEAKTWWNTIREEPKEGEELSKKDETLMKMKKMASTWQVRVFGAVAYIWLSRKILEFLNAPLEEQEEQETGRMF